MDTPKKSNRLQSPSPGKNTEKKYQSPSPQQPDVYIQEPLEPLSPFSVKQVHIFETPSPKKAVKIIQRRSREDRQK